MKKERFAKDWLFLYSIALIIASGAFLTLFFYVYSSAGSKTNVILLDRYYESLLYIAGFCTLIITPIAILYQVNQKKYAYQNWQLALRRNFYSFFIFLILLYILYLLYKFDISFKLLELIVALINIYIIYTFQSQLILNGYHAWKHPTTTASFILGIVKMGIFALILQMAVKNISGLIIILLSIEIMVIFARFRFLNRYSPESRQTSRLILIRYSILFGARMIIGLFIPLAYAIYNYIGSIQSFQFIGIFLVFGELIERYLFVYTAVPVIENTK